MHNGSGTTQDMKVLWEDAFKVGFMELGRIYGGMERCMQQRRGTRDRMASSELSPKLCGSHGLGCYWLPLTRKLP